jgi:hypothetical protein
MKRDPAQRRALCSSVDLSALSYLDTSVVATLLEAARIASSAQGVRLRVIGLIGEPRMLAQIAELDVIFRAYGSDRSSSRDDCGHRTRGDRSANDVGTLTIQLLAIVAAAAGRAPDCRKAPAVAYGGGAPDDGHRRQRIAGRSR